jgi:hypothetical protein
MTYGDFLKLVIKLHEMGNVEAPGYPIIKDLFDQIDLRKDGLIDQNEWNQVFNVGLNS